MHRFNDEDIDGLEVVDDFKVLKINMVHFIIMQVDLTLEEVKKEFARLKWIKFNDRCCVDSNCHLFTRRIRTVYDIVDDLEVLLKTSSIMVHIIIKLADDKNEEE